ncbi:MAG: arginine--tRNA ligase [Thermoplasmatota archaeon]
MAYPNPAVTYEEAFREAVAAAFRRLGIVADPVIETPRSGHADLCLVTFPLAKELRKGPGEIADSIKDAVPADDRWSLTVSEGYLNCHFDLDRYIVEGGAHLWSELSRFGKGPDKDELFIVEHTSANPNGPFHVGRARNPIIGDTLVRLLRFAGYPVEAQYWVNDMGKQVMILVWGIHNISPSTLSEPGMDKPDHDLVRYYQAANSRMEGDPLVEKRINDLLLSYEEAVKDGDFDRALDEDGSITVRDVRDACERVLKGMTASLRKMAVDFDSFVFESQVVEDHSLLGVIEGLKKSPLCREENGASYLDLSGEVKGGDDDKFKRRFVFTRSDGSALYTTRDLAYHKWKLSRCDHAVNVLGEDHKYQSMMLSMALRELGSEKMPETVFYSFVSLPEGKMSTRRNRVVFLDDLLEEAEFRAREEVMKRRPDLSEEEMEEISRAVGIGALRFNMIRVQPEKKIVFRWEDALNFEGSAAPFVQYSHARACSILRNLEGEKIADPEWTNLVEASEKELVKGLLRFPMVVEKAAGERKVHLVPQYLVELASAFNDFYRDCPVLAEGDSSRRAARIALVDIFRRVVADGLDVLGIAAPESM